MTARTYQGMSYRQLQKWNKEHLTHALDKQRKRLKLKNAGWNCVIKLYDWISSFISSSSSLLDQLAQKAKRLKQLESNIKAVIHSVTDEPYQSHQTPKNYQTPKNNIAEFVYR
ncbi:hypothetical protein [Leptothermofonsia sp. ETS-13]|uniref:hypothetical protein n=1 Tax=Leptothermofonsia sp. ETS-13 TaxID=3035696 RepID=UPI003B9EA1E6